jgi:hypothetical protein
MKAQLIQKEEISSLSFKNSMSISQYPDLIHQIEQATILGNTHHSKVGIYFHYDASFKKVETTIWAAGSKFICLKGGVWIPISRLVEIKM